MLHTNQTSPGEKATGRKRGRDEGDLPKNMFSSLHPHFVIKAFPGHVLLCISSLFVSNKTAAVSFITARPSFRGGVLSIVYPLEGEVIEPKAIARLRTAQRRRQRHQQW